MRAAIGIDDWKWSIFKRRLEAAGFKIVSKHPLTSETYVLSVEFDDFKKLHETIQDAQNEAAILRKVN